MKVKSILPPLFILLALGVICISYQYFYLQKAHSSFEDYYSFRGCTELLEKTDTYGTCKTKDGQTVKIVKINDKWYLEGDGPGVW